MTDEGGDIKVGFSTLFDSTPRAAGRRPGSGFGRWVFRHASFSWPICFSHIGLQKIVGTSGKGITVAVVDSGCRPSQREIKDRVLSCHQFFETSFSETSPRPKIVAGTDEWGHGTKMACIVAASQRNRGVATEAKILPIKVVDTSGKAISFKAVAAALEWLADASDEAARNVSVVNMSISDWGNHTDFDPAPTDLVRRRINIAIGKLCERNVVVVAAAGNAFAVYAPNSGMGFPAIVPGVISVGAIHARAQSGVFEFPFEGTEATITDPKPDDIAPFSQRIPHDDQRRTYTRIMAPGVEIPAVVLPVDPGDDPAIKALKQSVRADGTSAAAAIVSGVVALMQDAYRKQLNTHTLPSCEQIEAWLRASAQGIDSANFMRLDAFEAVRQARDPATS